MTAPAALAELAEEIARNAADVLLDHLRRPLVVETKSSGTDMVSQADRAAEDAIRALLAARRPDDAVLGEEGGAATGSSGLCWVVDPLDGTTNYLYAYPQWAVSIAVEDADGPLAGCVYDPSRGEAFVAARGAGARLDGVPIAVSAETDLARALVATGFSYDRALREAQGLVASRVLGACRDIRRGGSAALDLAWTACGRVDAYYETGLNPWDWSAGCLLVREAGGVAELGPGPHGEGQVLAASPRLAAALGAVLGAAPPEPRVG